MVVEQNFQPEEVFTRIKEQFDYLPYPVTEIENLPTDRAALYYHSISTAFYRRNREIVEPQGKTILDIGCGSGYKTLLLALANPGAKIVGIDLSDRSLDIARKRFAHHGIEGEFFQESLLDLPPSMSGRFDFINCDEVLYLMPDPIEALSVLKHLLKPRGGIIRGNLHSLFQRFHYYRAQEVFQMMGLMDSNPEEREIQTAIEVIKKLRGNVDLKKTWNPSYEGPHYKHAVLMNYLFQGDRGYTITDLFALLEASGLKFISMVNWKQWDLFDLFEPGTDWVLDWAFKQSQEHQLHLFELFHPIHRLLDFWCGTAVPTLPRNQEIQIVRLNPLLKFERTKQDLVDSITRFAPFNINAHLPINEKPFLIDSSVSVALIPLWEGNFSISNLAEYWRSIHPHHPMNGERVSLEEAIAIVGEMLFCLEASGYVFFS